MYSSFYNFEELARYLLELCLPLMFSTNRAYFLIVVKYVELKWDN